MRVVIRSLVSALALTVLLAASDQPGVLASPSRPTVVVHQPSSDSLEFNYGKTEAKGATRTPWTPVRGPVVPQDRVSFRVIDWQGVDPANEMFRQKYGHVWRTPLVGRPLLKTVERLDRDGNVVGREEVPIWDRSLPGNRSVPAVTHEAAVAGGIEQVLRLQVPVPSVQTSPERGRYQVVNLPTWWWFVGQGVQSVRRTLDLVDGTKIEATAIPYETWWVASSQKYAESSEKYRVSRCFAYPVNGDHLTDQACTVTYTYPSGQERARVFVSYQVTYRDVDGVVKTYPKLLIAEPAVVDLQVYERHALRSQQ